jgi:LytS/YehU family sensor histidine kinase
MKIIQLILTLLTSLFKSSTVTKQAEASLALAQATELAVVNTIVANSNVAQTAQLVKTQDMLEAVQITHNQEIQHENIPSSTNNPFDQSW